MDPDAAFTTMTDGKAPSDDRYEAANALLTWIRAGGFLPNTWQATGRSRNALDKKCRRIAKWMKP